MTKYLLTFNLNLIMKKIIFIIGGIILVAVAGRANWAWQQVKNDMAKAALVATAPVPTTTKNVSLKLDDTTMVASSGPNIKVSGSINIEDKLIFTSAQLAALKADMIKSRLAQNSLQELGKDINTEPLKSQISRELDDIFYKDLGVKNVSTENFGVLLYPEIAAILAEIKKQYPSNAKSVYTPPVSKITISDLSYDTISVSDKKNKLPPTFKISYNGESLKCVAWDISIFGVSGSQLSNIPTSGSLNDCPYSQFTKNEYSYPYLFGSTDYSSSFFSQYGIDHIVLEFYVRDMNNGVSNRLKFTFTK